MTSWAVSSDGVPVAYDVTGEGLPAIVFVHGWACDRSYWSDQVERFAAAHLVVTVDLGAHGDSGIERSHWELSAFGADVVAVVDALELGDVVLVGHSFGGDVVTDAAARLGDRVRCVVWADTYRSLDDEDDPEELEQFLASFSYDFPGATAALVRGMFRDETPAGLVDRVVAGMSSRPRDLGLKSLRVALNCEPLVKAMLPAVAAPVYAINPGYRPSDEVSLARHGVRLTVVPEAGHFLMMENPQGFNRALARVIESSGRTRS